MITIDKKSTLTLIYMLIISGLLLIEPCIAPVTTPNKPVSGPEITSVIIHNNPFIAPPIYTSDPYTGESYQTSAGYTAPNGSIIITLKNQPFTTYTDENGDNINAYYSFFWKNSNNPWGDNFPVSLYPYAVYQSDSGYTVVTFTYGTSPTDITKLGFFDGGSIDFRVQTVIGYFNRFNEYSNKGVYEGEGSAWTEFSLDIPRSDESASSKPVIPSITVPVISGSSNSPQKLSQPYLLIIVVSVCIIAVLLVVIAYLLKQRRAILLNGEFVRFGEVEM
jgi:hypothetical protein